MLYALIYANVSSKQSSIMNQYLCWSVSIHQRYKKVMKVESQREFSASILNKCQAAQTWYYVCKGHLQCADKKSEVRFMVSLRSWSIDGLDMGAQLPKVVKVNQLPHIHPLAFEACIQQLATVQGKHMSFTWMLMYFRGHLLDMWQPKSNTR